MIDATLSGRDVSVGDPELDRLLQGAVTLDVEGGRTDERVDVKELVLKSSSLLANIAGVVTEISKNPTFEGAASLASTDLSVFSNLAGRELSGQIELTAKGAVSADLTTLAIDATTRGTDLALGVEGIDPLLQGTVTLSAKSERSGDSATIENLTLSSAALNASIAGNLTNITENPAFAGRIEAESPNLSVFSALAKRPLAGQLTLNATGGANADMSAAQIDATANASGLSVGIAEADRLLSGSVSLTLRAGRSGDRIEIETVDFESASLTAETSGRLGGEEDELSIRARLADIAPFVAGFSGPASVDGTVGRSGETLTLDLAATGPGGTRADVTGTVAESFETANLDIGRLRPPRPREPLHRTAEPGRNCAIRSSTVRPARIGKPNWPGIARQWPPRRPVADDRA